MNIVDNYHNIDNNTKDQIKQYMMSIYNLPTEYQKKFLENPDRGEWEFVYNKKPLNNGGQSNLFLMQKGKSEKGILKIYNDDESYLQEFSIFKRLKRKAKKFKDSPDQHYYKIYNENIVKMIGVVDKGKILLEYLGETNLLDYIQENDIDIPDKLYIFSKIVNGIELLHKCGIAHRDIKLNNIMINPEKKINDNIFYVPSVKVIDFGLACVKTKSKNMFKSAVGSWLFCSPEIINDLYNDNDEGLYDPFKSDIWSLGITLYCLINERVPFKSVSESSEEFIKFINGKIDFRNDSFINYSSEIETKVKNIILSCCKIDPKKRLNIYKLSKSLNKLIKDFY